MLKRLRNAALISLITLVMLEAALQLIYLGVWLFYPRHDDSVQAGERVVMCVGDSFTYGEGKSRPEFAYPAQMEAILKERAGSDWRVVNYGWPGTNSRHVLERLDAQLERCRPELVYVIIGVNDRWAHPQELVLASSEAAQTSASPADSFRFELRTLKLLRIFSISEPFARTRAEPEVDRSVLVGSWLSEHGHLFELRGDGTGDIKGKPVLWSADASRFHVSASGIEVLDADWEVTGRKLLLDAEGARDMVLHRVSAAGERAPAVRSNPPSEGVTLRAGTDAAGEGDYGRAERIFRRLSDSEVDEQVVRAHMQLAKLYVRTQEEDQLDEELSWLRSAYRQQPSELGAACLLLALRDAGAVDEARVLAPELMRAYPTNVQVAHAFAMLSFQADDLPEACRAIDQVMANLGDQDDRAWFWFDRARIYASVDPVEAMRACVRAFTLGDKVSLARTLMMRLREKVDRAALERIFDELEVPRSHRERLLQLHANPEEVHGEDPAAVYRSHLTQLVERCSAVGARVVLASYPFGNPFWDVQREVAASSGAGLVELHTEFRQISSENPETDYFISDGHCNDAGYRLMAEILAADALARIRM